MNSHHSSENIKITIEINPDMILQKIEQLLSKFQKSGNHATPQLESKS